MPSFLLIDDDEAHAGLLRRVLSEDGLSGIDVASDGEQALSLSSSTQYNVIILELEIPKIDGLTVLRRLRERGISAPILVLSRRATVADRVQALWAGADDYLCKPFDLEELQARLRALSRRAAAQALKLRAADLETMGLSCALPIYVKGFSERSGIQVHLDMPAELGRLGRDVEITLYRIVQEALSNVHRHSRSRTAEITLSPRVDSVVLEVADQGCGLPPSPDGHRLGVGIAGMRERVRLLGGSLELKSGKPGTTIRVVLPFAAASSPSPSVDALDLSELA